MKTYTIALGNYAGGKLAYKVRYQQGIQMVSTIVTGNTLPVDWNTAKQLAEERNAMRILRTRA